MLRTDGGRSPASKLILTIFIGLALTVPLFSVWLLVYDRKSQSEEAIASITTGWGAAQTLAGPVLIIPYVENTTETVTQAGKLVTQNRGVRKELTLAPEVVELSTSVTPEVRKRSIYEAVVYDAGVSGQARFVFPSDLSRTGVSPAQMDFGRAELRFGLSDPRGLGANPHVSVGGQALRLQPGGGSTGGSGFFAWVDAHELQARPIVVAFQYNVRGNASLSLAPDAGDTRWKVESAWPHPSFGGAFLPDSRSVGADGFKASYQIGNLALGRSLVSTSDRSAKTSSDQVEVTGPAPEEGETTAAEEQTAELSLIQPVDPYSQVNRATKYGFLFIGFTFLALLMFDVIGGVRVSGVEYLLMGAALVLFFVLLLAFAEVIGFASAYIVATAAVAGLNTAYSAAVLGSWRRGAVIGVLLLALYAVLYILLSLEAFSLLIGSLLLFAALAGVMYATRQIDWAASSDAAARAG